MELVPGLMSKLTVITSSQLSEFSESSRLNSDMIAVVDSSYSAL